MLEVLNVVVERVPFVKGGIVRVSLDSGAELTGEQREEPAQIKQIQWIHCDGGRRRSNLGVFIWEETDPDVGARGIFTELIPVNFVKAGHHHLQAILFNIVEDPDLDFSYLLSGH